MKKAPEAQKGGSMDDPKNGSDVREDSLLHWHLFLPDVFKYKNSQIFYKKVFLCILQAPNFAKFS